MATSKKAVAKYNAKTYELISFRVKKGKKEIIKNHIETVTKESINGFINRAIDKAIEEDVKSDFVNNKQ